MKAPHFAIVVAIPVFVGTATAGESSANFGVTSNYVWRGETRSDDGPAVSGGVDYAHDSGLYTGLWASDIVVKRVEDGNVEDSREYELDWYGGYHRRYGRVRLEAGLIAYAFPRGNVYGFDTGSLVSGTENDQDFVEAYLGLRYKWLEAKYSYTDDYFGSGERGAYSEVAWRDEAVLQLHYGLKEGDAIDDHIGFLGDYRVAVTVGELRFAVSGLDDNEDARQSDNVRLAVTWRHEIPFR